MKWIAASRLLKESRGADSRPASRCHGSAGPASVWLVALLSLACGGSQVELPSIGQPARGGDALSWIRRFAMDRVLDFSVWRRAEAGFVALVARNGRVVWGHTTGFSDVEDRVPMTLETRFQLASMTKPITAVARRKNKRAPLKRR